MKTEELLSQNNAENNGQENSSSEMIERIPFLNSRVELVTNTSTNTCVLALGNFKLSDHEFANKQEAQQWFNDNLLEVQLRLCEIVFTALNQ